MNKTKPIIITFLVTLAGVLVAAPSAQADVYSCTFDALGSMEPGAEAIQPDLAGTGADGLFEDRLTDTENGIREPALGWEDGFYTFSTFSEEISLCMTVDTNGPADDGATDTGLYTAAIDSHGAYDNTVCGTGLAIDRGAGDPTTVDLTAIQAFGPGEDIADANYRITVAAGTGTIDITEATSSSGEVLSGIGVVQIVPVIGNCVTTNLTEFELVGAFTASGL